MHSIKSLSSILKLKNKRNPVLIGSSAMQYYGFNCKPNDYDLIHNQPILNQKFDKPLDLHNIETMEHCSAFKYIYEKCNDLGHTVKFISGIDVHLPPLEWLYALKKGHIHRIIPFDKKDHHGNVQKWKRSMDMYYLMAKKLDEKLSEESKMIYNFNFADTNARFGDTAFNLDVENEKFFVDNVSRFIDHDQLHAEWNSINCNQLSFLKFKRKITDGSMDCDMFLGASDMEKIQILKDEISVLFMERYLLKCLSPNDIKINFDDCASHFTTNLCGRTWLRDYALDNYHILGEYSNYDFSKMDTLVRKILKRVEPKIEKKDDKKTFADYLRSLAGPDGTIVISVDDDQKFSYNIYTNISKCETKKRAPWNTSYFDKWFGKSNYIEECNTVTFEEGENQITMNGIYTFIPVHNDVSMSSTGLIYHTGDRMTIKSNNLNMPDYDRGLYILIVRYFNMVHGYAMNENYRAKWII